MKAILAAFRQFLRAIWSDAMLAACLFAPVMMALVLRCRSKARHASVWSRSQPARRSSVPGVGGRH